MESRQLAPLGVLALIGIVLVILGFTGQSGTMLACFLDPGDVNAFPNG